MVLVLDLLAVFEFGIICEVFGIDRSADGVPNSISRSAGRSRRAAGTSVGASITPIMALMTWSARIWWQSQRSRTDYLPEALEAVKAAADSGRSSSRCARLHSSRRRRASPTAGRARRTGCTPTIGPAKSEPRRSTATCSSSTTGISWPAQAPQRHRRCLHLVRRELGSEVTNEIARRMVVPPAARRRPTAVHRSTDAVADLGALCAASDGSCPTSTSSTLSPLSLPRAHMSASSTFGAAVCRGDRARTDAVGAAPIGACSMPAPCSRKPTSTSTASPSVPASRRPPHSSRRRFRRGIVVARSDSRRRFLFQTTAPATSPRPPPERNDSVPTNRSYMYDNDKAADFLRHRCDGRDR